MGLLVPAASGIEPRTSRSRNLCLNRLSYHLSVHMQHIYLVTIIQIWDKCYLSINQWKVIKETEARWFTEDKSRPRTPILYSPAVYLWFSFSKSGQLSWHFLRVIGTHWFFVMVYAHAESYACNIATHYLQFTHKGSSVVRLQNP